MCVFVFAGDQLHNETLRLSTSSAALEDMDINLDALSVDGDVNFDLLKSVTSTSVDLDQFASWSNFPSPLTTISDTPAIESSLQMGIMNAISVTSSEIEDHLGSPTTNLADASSVTVEPQTYSKHQRKGAGGDRIYACPIDDCARSFFHNSELSRHLKIHGGQKPFQCPLCSRSFFCSYQLIIHNRVHSGEKPYSCDTCGRRFGRSYAKKRHVKVHLKKKTKKNGASGSDNSRKSSGDDLHNETLRFSTSSAALEDMDINLDALSVESEVNFDLPESVTSTSFDLDQFASWTNFPSPLTTISDTPAIESSIQMGIMNASSVTSSDIEDHLGSPNTNLAEASSVTVEPQTYSKQQRKAAGGDRLYACPIVDCARSYFRNCHLTRHLKIHSGQKPFQCTVCSRSFSWSYHLITHNRVHSGEKPLLVRHVRKKFRKDRFEDETRQSAPEEDEKRRGFWQ
ncbi:hypothetical protein CDAR_231891 [Caerostris darwini]|uniref:C2H2-type domain-containing protein n=1 Tax=Caerostris darwini TaxID=1538125 RepID=A0AAV4N2H8_9ARAC|nr:hypothetical protein CDAR_231891 [Caerostris darwini]